MYVYGSYIFRACRIFISLSLLSRYSYGSLRQRGSVLVFLHRRLQTNTTTNNVISEYKKSIRFFEFVRSTNQCDQSIR